MSKKDLNITVNANGQDFEINLCDYSKESDILDSINETITQGDRDAELATSFEVTDWQDVPENCRHMDVAMDLADYYGNSYQDLDVFEAAREAGIDFSNVDDSYQGEYKSDIDFAQETADQLGAVDKNASWPMTCINWEQAAKELMYDYSEANGHYFRT